MGRKSSYTEALTDEICARIAAGESLKAICRDEGKPSASTVFLWLEEREEFRTKYARARAIQAEMMAEELLEIADDGTNDWMERKNSSGKVIGWAENGEALRRSQLRVATRQWIASKLLPKKYGDKTVIEGGDKPIQHEHTLGLSEAAQRAIDAIAAAGEAPST